MLACGGFESNPEMRTRYLGPGWELCRVRGTRHNTGRGIQAALDIGAQPFGGWSTCHAVQWDISAPPFGDRVVLDNFQKHSYPIGIVVNLEGERFIDEGADYRNHTYAKYGREVMKQPKRTAVQIFDAKTIDMVRDEYRIKQVTKYQANTLEDLAASPGDRPAGTCPHRDRVQSAPAAPGSYNPSILDGVKTEGITPPKSNWALPIDKPPFTGFVVTCGITFTFGGLRIDNRAAVLDTGELRRFRVCSRPASWSAAFSTATISAGAGLMSGAVFGRLAGASAASYAREWRACRADEKGSHS